MKYSNNPKLQKYLQSIEDDLMSMEASSEKSIAIMRHYRESFPKEPDHNIVQYGRLSVSLYQIRQRQVECGYSAKAVARCSDDAIWSKYLQQVGSVVREILQNTKA